MAEILDGLKVSKEIKEEIRAEVEKLLKTTDVRRIWSRYWSEKTAPA